MSPTMASAMKVITIDHTRSIDPGDIVHVMPGAWCLRPYGAR